MESPADSTFPFLAGLGGVLLALGGCVTGATPGDGRFGPTPHQVEAALDRDAGRFCEALIDACLDEDNNMSVVIPTYRVSQLECRRAAAGRARCAFRSEEYYGATRTRKLRCTARFVSDVAGTGWGLETIRQPVRRAVLDCK